MLLDNVFSKLSRFFKGLKAINNNLFRNSRSNSREEATGVQGPGDRVRADEEGLGGKLSKPTGASGQGM